MKETIASLYYFLFTKQIIFFLAGVFVSSCIYGLSIAQHPKHFFTLYVREPQQSFTRIAKRDGTTFTHSYTAHKRNVRFAKIAVSIGVILLVIGLFL